MRWLVPLLFAGALAAADAPSIFYSKTFPASKPPYMEVTLDQAGNGAYREAVDDDQPVKFHLSDADTREVFDLAARLDHFKHPLESGLKVAFMGTKTFRWEADGQKAEVKFNYSEDPSAQALADWFERMVESEQRRIQLETAAKYDRLGVDQALRELWSSLDRKRLVALEQYLPMLDRIANNESYMHTARMKAAEIGAQIRAAKP